MITAPGTASSRPPGPRARVVTRLNEETARILHSPETKALFLAEGAGPVGNKPEEFAATIKSEIAKWAKVIQAAGMKAD